VNKIDRYLSGLFWVHFFGGLLVFVTMFTAMDALGMMVQYKDVAFSAWLAYYGYSIPEMIYRMVPVACVLSIVFTLSTLQRANELVALYSIGMSLLRVCAPMLVWVVVLCAVEFTLGDRVLPNFARNKNFIFYNDVKKNPSLYSTVKNQRIWYRSHDIIFNLKTLNEKQHKGQGITLYYLSDNWELIQLITAKEVDFDGSQWKLHDGSVTLFTEDSSFPLSSQFKTKTILMGEDSKDLSSSGNTTSEMLSIDELKQFIKKNKEAGLDTVRYEVDLYSKYSYTLAALVMALLGIPFSVNRSRSGGTMMNLGICLGLIFSFWISYTSSITLGNYGHLPPMVAAWAPILLCLGVAYIFIRRVRL
jgi:lipopolysaccharide export system permease protein